MRLKNRTIRAAERVRSYRTAVRLNSIPKQWKKIKFGIEFALCTVFLRATRQLLAFKAERRKGNFPRQGSLFDLN